MTTQEAIDYYGGRKKLAMALELWANATYHWGEHPPMRVQYELQVKTKGDLMAEGETNETST